MHKRSAQEKSISVIPLFHSTNGPFCHAWGQDHQIGKWVCLDRILSVSVIPPHRLAALPSVTGIVLSEKWVCLDRTLKKRVKGSREKSEKINKNKSKEQCQKPIDHIVKTCNITECGM